MSWIDSVRPKIRNWLNKRETPENLWIKCPETGEMVFYRDLEANLWVVPNSGYHMRIKGHERLKSLYDEGKYEEVDFPDVALDPLKFRDSRRYTDRLKDAKAKTNQKDAIIITKGHIDALKVVVAVQEFDFLGGSLGMAAGNAVVAAMELAIKEKAPFIMFAASGGARMQEGILSLMQMPRTTVAIQRMRAEKLPYIVVLTNPTTGGVTASYAMLGDIHIAEPGALICFAGPRVIEQTIREKLPAGFQRSEYLYDHGMIDMVVSRHDMRPTLSKLCRMFMKKEAVASKPVSVGLDAAASSDKAQPVTPDELPDNAIVQTEIEAIDMIDNIGSGAKKSVDLKEIKANDDN